MTDNRKLTARQLAYNVLMKIQKENAFSNLSLNSALKNCGLEPRDKSFASALVYGVIERRITIDYILSLYLSKPLKKMKPEPLTALRLGAYQILFSSGVPDSAAVNESVKLSKNNGFSYSSGLINAVLRKVSGGGLVFPSTDDRAYDLSIRYSCPQWLVEKWISEYGEENTLSVLIHSLDKKRVTVRANTLKTTVEKLKASLEAQGISCEYGRVKNSLDIELSGAAIEGLSEFKNGLFHVQGIPSQLCAAAVGAEEGDVVFDLCAAPGGKTFTIAQMMKNKGLIRAFDIYEKRAQLIADGAERLGISIIETGVVDASVFEPSLGLADRVLCDVPCSGLGIISKKPEIKYKDENELAELPDIQLSILENGSEYVKSGGRLVYSTCTLSKAENESVCERFLKQHSEFVAVSPFENPEKECFATFFPDEHNSDGFFVAAFERKDIQ